MSELPESLVNALASRYRIDRPIGAGGMATVYLARDLKHDRDVAIKVLRPDLAAAVSAERFVSEIRTIAHLKHASYTPSANIWSIDIPARGVASVRTAQQLTFGSQKIEKLALSWDGQWLAYDSDRNGQADVWKVRLAGGAPEQVTKGPNPKFVNEWSPDGQEIVFHTIREGSRRDIRVVSADGLTTETVVATPAEEQHSGWSPDGNSIIFDSSSALGADIDAFIVTREKRGAPWSAPRRLTRHGSTDPKWSPDGTTIAHTPHGQLRTIAPDGANERVLVQPDPTGDIAEVAYPVWSRDSRTIYFKAYDSKRQSSIWAISADGGSPQVLVRFDDPAHRSLRREFATDGKRFYFTISGEESDIWVMELSSKYLASGVHIRSGRSIFRRCARSRECRRWKSQ